ncbi:MAG: hypothetical protein ACK45U_03745 [bacterium]|jgi:hypothetical protein
MKHSDKKNEFDDLMKNAFDGFEMEPNESVWVNIEKDLDKKKKSTVVLWVTRMSIAASLLLLLGVGLYQINYNVDATESQNLASTTLKADSTISLPLQPIEKSQRLAEVVEIKTKSNRSSKVEKKSLKVASKNKIIERTQEEKDAIELLKKFEEKAQTNNSLPVSEPEQKRPVIIKPIPSPTIASNGSKNQIDVIDMLNMVASKVTGDESKLVAINETKSVSGSSRKKVQVDLGIVKFRRIKNTD